MIHEQGQRPVIKQLRENARIIDNNITCLTNALEGKNGSSVDADYMPTTQIWLAELRGMQSHTRYMLGETTFEEMLDDANLRARERYVDGLYVEIINKDPKLED